jgi:hypothetical protein
MDFDQTSKVKGHWVKLLGEGIHHALRFPYWILIYSNIYNNCDNLIVSVFIYTYIFVVLVTTDNKNIKMFALSLIFNTKNVVVK